MYCVVLTARWFFSLPGLLFIIMPFCVLLVCIMASMNSNPCTCIVRRADFTKESTHMNCRLLAFSNWVSMTFLVLVFLLFPPFWFYYSTHVVSAAILKVRMEQAAELVLIATRSECRKKVEMKLKRTLHSWYYQLSHVINMIYSTFLTPKRIRRSNA